MVCGAEDNALFQSSLLYWRSRVSFFLHVDHWPPVKEIEETIRRGNRIINLTFFLQRALEKASISWQLSSSYWRAHYLSSPPIARQMKRAVHKRLNPSWKISSSAVDGQSFFVIDGSLLNLDWPSMQLLRRYIPSSGRWIGPSLRPIQIRPERKRESFHLLGISYFLHHQPNRLEGLSFLKYLSCPPLFTRSWNPFIYSRNRPSVPNSCKLMSGGWEFIFYFFISCSWALFTDGRSKRNSLATISKEERTQLTGCKEIEKEKK